jgi:hypothetical protein
MSLHLVTPSIIKLLELTGLRGSFTILPEPG